MKTILIFVLVYLFVWPRVRRHNKKYFEKRMEDFKDWRNGKTDADN